MFLKTPATTASRIIFNSVQRSIAFCINLLFSLQCKADDWFLYEMQYWAKMG